MAAAPWHQRLRAVPPWAWVVLALTLSGLAVFFVVAVLPVLARLLIVLLGAPVGPL